jgi:hypothetical protein
MLKVGDETEGYCLRCRLNTYQSVAATDGRTIFTATCRTCRNTVTWKAEVSAEEVRAKQMKKLGKLQRDRPRMMSAPEVISKRPARGGDLAGPLRELSKLTGKPMGLPPEADSEAPKAIVGTPAPVNEILTRWQALTAKLSSRDGKPYQLTRTYKPGDVVLHKAHGLGVVQSVVNESACLVLFREQETVLQMGVSALSLER